MDLIKGLMNGLLGFCAEYYGERKKGGESGIYDEEKRRSIMKGRGDICLYRGCILRDNWDVCEKGKGKAKTGNKRVLNQCFFFPSCLCIGGKSNNLPRGIPGVIFGLREHERGAGWLVRMSREEDEDGTDACVISKQAGWLAG